MRIVRFVAAFAAVIALAGCTIIVSPPPPDAIVQVTNGYSQSITALYISPSWSSDWGDSLIPGAPIGFDQTVSLSVTPGTYDLEAVAADGYSWTEYDVPLASGATYSWILTVP